MKIEFSNLQERDVFRKFAEIISAHAVPNTVDQKSQYPILYINSDQSISLFSDRDEDKIFFEGSDFGVIAEKIKRHQDFNSIEFDKEFLLLSNHTDGLKEYRFCVKLEDMDAILRNDDLYNGYKANGSIMRLAGDFVLKKDRIRLFPVNILKDKQSDNEILFIAAIGCQITEMPSIQMIRLMPDFSKKMKVFHRVPEALISKGIDASVITEAIRAILLDAGMAEGMEVKDFFRYTQGGEVLFANIPLPQSFCYLEEISDDDMAFYSTYSNLSKAEMLESNCKHLEVNTLAFLKQIGKIIFDDFVKSANEFIVNKGVINKVLANGSVYTIKLEISDIENANKLQETILIIEKMIKKVNDHSCQDDVKDKDFIFFSKEVELIQKKADEMQKIYELMEEGRVCAASDASSDYKDDEEAAFFVSKSNATTPPLAKVKKATKEKLASEEKSRCSIS